VTRVRTNTASARRGFSLVEILIAILVLAFGLLGLAAIFPVVVTQQRDAADRMLGPAAASAIEAQVFGASQLVDWSGPAERIAAAQGSLGPEARKLWNVTTFAKTDPDGLLRLAGQSGQYQDVPAASRVFPTPFGSAPPQFVWDVAVRRTSSNAPLEVALFVRRIDSAIRVPKDKSLTNVLTGWGLASGVPGALPVAVDAGSGRPTSDGVGDYATIQVEKNVTPIRVRSDRPFDRFNATGLTSIERTLLAQRGQKFVDSEGIVRTVVKLDEQGRVVVEPAWTRQEPVQILWVPQTPVAVKVIRVETDS